MKILITGATGLIGQELIRLWIDKKHEIHYLTTRKNHKHPHPNITSFYWNPENGSIDSNCFDGVQVVVNLAGASVSKRWTSSYKEKIRESRIKGAELLLNAIQKLPSHEIQQLISASAIGVYPHDLHCLYTEKESKIADSFLGTVVNQWESAVQSFAKINIPVTTVRIGLVLSNQGGALPMTALPIRYGVGSWFGSGQQWQSWIHIEDMVRIIDFTVVNKLEGVYNAVAPQPVTNKEFVKTIARVLHRPLFLPPIPQFFMKLILGEMASVIFESQRVSSQKIQNAGFEFHFSKLQGALVALFHK
ncbi:MAG: TIGR01777 family oxidoreductase [Flavobacteriaceae bacterium]|nr:TIGR01777 family oxidoreductase [Flavobacteriaceae bacterium]MDG2314809.1 TIGR01777 family oxidoreductase [Flavobacteriaceae bacterium]